MSRYRVGDIGHNVKGYGALGNGSADDTTAIQAAQAAAGQGVVYFPPGTYKITSALVATVFQTLQGAGSNATFIKQFTDNVPIVKATANNTQRVKLRGLSLGYNTSQAGNTGAVGLGFDGAGNTYYNWLVEDVTIDKAYDGIGLINTSAVVFSNQFNLVQITESAHSAVRFDAVTGSPGNRFGLVYVSNSAVTPTAEALLLKSQEAAFEYLVVSGWSGRVLETTANSLSIAMLHVESHDWTLATGNGLLDLFGGQIDIEQASIQGTWNVAATGNAVLFRVINSGTRATIGQLRTAITNSGAGSPNIFSTGAGTFARLDELRVSSGFTPLSAVNTTTAFQGVKHFLTSPRSTVVTLTDAATVTVDASAGDYQKLSAGGSRTIGLPSYPGPGQRLTFDILNNTAGAITTTWNAAFKLAGVWTDPAAGLRRTITFIYDGTSWIEESRSAADI